MSCQEHRAKQVSSTSMFNTVELNDQGNHKLHEIGRKFAELLAVIEVTVPSSRERAIIITKLQEAAMFVRLGISLQPLYQKVEGE